LKKKITIITPTFNSAQTIKLNIQSIQNQSYINWEHLIIDNHSVDNTLEIINKNFDLRRKVLSEKDDGIYDAINKGINIAKGEIISILHSDDMFFDNNTLKEVINKFNTCKTDIVYGNLIYVRKNDITKILRYWKSCEFKSGLFNKGWSPPHPSFFVKKKIYKKLGIYKNEIGNPADIELMHRMLEKHKIANKYLNKILVKMRYGGKSNNNFIEIFRQNLQIIKFLKLKGFFEIYTYIYFKIINRMSQFFKK
tara:strand:+ start:2575 stop:3330 length:756 start_codon:yes stop_codon:yes gene_type:complete